MIAGAGATGLEAAGYIKSKNPNLKVGVCLRGKTVLPYIKGANETVVKCFKELGINIHFGTSFEGEATAKALDYSCVVDCMGYKFHGPRKYMTGDLARCLDKQNGQIQVNWFGQVCEKYPLTISRSDN